MMVDKVEPSEVAGVFVVYFKGLEGSPLVEMKLELPRQLLMFKKGDKVTLELAESPISWGEKSDLHLRARIFGLKPIEGVSILYASAGGLQLRLSFKESSQRFQSLSKVYIAFKIMKETG
ncbi:MAG: hypothetical protein DRN06_03295 [Thermoprotei archaeon]|nr:MAG: hypothetical protein DRN06_03295 [Thermoprotei archaeon]